MARRVRVKRVSFHCFFAQLESSHGKLQEGGGESWITLEPRVTAWLREITLSNRMLPSKVNQLPVCGGKIPASTRCPLIAQGPRARRRQRTRWVELTATSYCQSVVGRYIAAP